jgi:tropomyosin
MAALRVECDEANTQVEEMKARIKVLEQENLAKEQEITSLTHKNSVLEADIEKLETGIKEAKAAAEEGSHAGSQAESLTRKIQLLEEEAEQADRDLRETNEKYDYCPFCVTETLTQMIDRLRQTDVKAGHYERKVQALEQSNGQWEQKYEEMAKKYQDTKKELDDFVAEIGNI